MLTWSRDTGLRDMSHSPHIRIEPDKAYSTKSVTALSFSTSNDGHRALAGAGGASYVAPARRLSRLTPWREARIVSARSAGLSSTFMSKEGGSHGFPRLHTPAAGSRVV